MLKYGKTWFIELIPGYLNGIEATYTPPKGYFVAEENPDVLLI